MVSTAEATVEGCEQADAILFWLDRRPEMGKFAPGKPAQAGNSAAAAPAFQIIQYNLRPAKL